MLYIVHRVTHTISRTRTDTALLTFCVCMGYRMPSELVSVFKLHVTDRTLVLKHSCMYRHVTPQIGSGRETFTAQLALIWVS